MTGHLSQPVLDRSEVFVSDNDSNRLLHMVRRQLGGLWLVVLFLVTALVVGYLSFGHNVLTTSPSVAQVSECRTAMAISKDARITPLGIKMLDAGWHTDAIWFKFDTTTPLSELFDTSMVDLGSFNPQFLMGIGATSAKWWDVAHQRLPGGEVLLPDNKTMSVAVRKNTSGHTVYIFWYER
ncbi:MAG: hypothetical protein JXX14_22225 [Deltaproteobacteria bacterium]|nr:hypothetical protein [Deltaproteobacteria bacterium]